MTAEIRASTFGFAIQVDESTNVTDCCKLLVDARYTHGNNVKTVLLMRKELSKTSNGKDIFNLLDKFFKQNDLDWGNYLNAQLMVLLPCLVESQGFKLM